MNPADQWGATDGTPAVRTARDRTPDEFDELLRAISTLEAAASRRRRREAPVTGQPVRRRWGLWLVLLLVAGEAGVFYWENRDIVTMNRPTDALVVDAGFTDAARAVLARGQVSRRVLEVVANVARQRDELDLHLEAMQRIVSVAPDDARARMRLAQALSDNGRLAEAEQMYRDEIGVWAEARR